MGLLIGTLKALAPEEAPDSYILQAIDAPRLCFSKAETAPIQRS